MARPSYWFRRTVVAVTLAVLTCLLYAPAGRFGFVNYDDDEYVEHNDRVLGGLSWDTARWAFTTGYAGNYHPLTWLSLAADRSVPVPGWDAFVGRRPNTFDGQLHRTNVALHAASVAVLFLLLAIPTGADAAAAVAAAVFAVHPVHVESVAWVSERKDVLCGFFYLSAVLAHVAVRRPIPRVAATTLLGAAALLSKPMAVSLPLMLLAVDLWPARRRLTWLSVAAQGPLLAMAGALCVVTLKVQAAGGAVQSLGDVPLAARAQNVPVAYVRYLGLAAWPVGLSVFYPYRNQLPLWAVGASVVGLLLVTVVAVRAAGRRPYVTVGWLWFVVTLVPVVGVVQVGWQSLADRYLYLPLVGPIVVAVWGGRDLIRSAGGRAGLAVAVVTTLAVLMERQLTYWSDTRTLFEHSLAVTADNPIAHAQLGYLDKLDGHPDAAERHYAEAVRLVGRYTDAANNLGVLLQQRGDHAGAVRSFELALRSRPGNPTVEDNLGVALMADDPAAAERHLRSAIAAAPGRAGPHVHLGQLLQARGRPAEAAVEFRAAHQLDPSAP